MSAATERCSVGVRLYFRLKFLMSCDHESGRAHFPSTLFFLSLPSKNFHQEGSLRPRRFTRRGRAISVKCDTFIDARFRQMIQAHLATFLPLGSISSFRISLWALWIVWGKREYLLMAICGHASLMWQRITAQRSGPALAPKTHRQ